LGELLPPHHEYEARGAAWGPTRKIPTLPIKDPRCGGRRAPSTPATTTMTSRTDSHHGWPSWSPPHKEMRRKKSVPPPPSPPFPQPRQTRACCLSLSLARARSGEYTQGPGPRRSTSRSRTRAWGGSRRTFAGRTSLTATQSVWPPATMRLCWGPSSSTLQGRGPDSPRQGARHSPGLRHQHHSGCRAPVSATTVSAWSPSTRTRCRHDC
jgi:hypothetical protein